MNNVNAENDKILVTILNYLTLHHGEAVPVTSRRI